MAFGTQDNSDEVMNEINMTPLVDIMLVLLVIFIITIPVMQHAVHVELPLASNQANTAKPETIRLDVDASGAYFWNGAPLQESALAAKLTAAASAQPQAELHIRGDRAVRYERVARVMAAAQRAGMQKIGFITEPD
jgi:biopolymer transport protein ExbD